MNWERNKIYKTNSILFFMAEFYLSDFNADFVPNNSLNEIPAFFQTDYAFGYVFYLAHNNALGGDSFIIKGGDSLTVSLVEDMTGHGYDARQKIIPLMADLEKIAEVASLPNSTKKDISKVIASLDMRLNYDSLLALSLVKISKNGTISYMNEGENTLLIRKKDGLYSMSEKSRGKVGLFKLAYDVDIILDKLIPYDDKLSSGDRIFICTDGVVESFLDDQHILDMKTMLFDEIRNNPSLEDAILPINNKNYNYSLKNDNLSLLDDYTIVALELK